MRNKEYFSACQDTIAASNRQSLLTCTKFFFLFLLIYSIFTYFLLPSPTLTLLYAIFLIGDIGFMIFAERCFHKESVSFKMLQNMCMLFIILILAFTISISIFPFPDRPGIFYPIAYMLVSVLFYFSYNRISAVLNIMSIIYLILTAYFKTPATASYDFFSCITTCILDYFLLYIITDLRLRNGEAMQELKHLSRTDFLTGLLNRRGAEKILSRNFRRCQSQGIPCAVIMMDIDDFKKYNDTLGHIAGDNCLKTVGELLLSYAQDIGIIAVRYGGEEFLLLLPNCPLDNAKTAVFNLLTYIRNEKIPAPNGFVTASIGVAVQVPNMTDTLESLIQHADSMLYQAKNNGKNHAVIVDLSRDESENDRIFSLKL